MKPAYKVPEVWNHLSNLNARFREDGKRVYIPDAIREDKCAQCDGEATVFDSGLDEAEYAMTGFCQRCRDKLYASLERDNKGGEPI